MKKSLMLLVVALAAVAAQPALADGRGHHRGHGNGWLPFAAGAVIGGVVVGSWLQPQPVYAQPMYMAPPPPRMVVQRPYYAPAPMYVVPSVQPGYYYERD